MSMAFDERAEISLYGRDFEATRNELDARLRDTVAELVAKGLTDGSVTLKIDADITSVIQSREKTKCGVIVAGTKELVFDGDGHAFALTPEEASGQLSMFAGGLRA